MLVVIAQIYNDARSTEHLKYRNGLYCIYVTFIQSLVKYIRLGYKIFCEIRNWYWKQDFTLSCSLLKNLNSVTLILLKWRIWWASKKANEWQVGFYSTFKELNEKNNIFLIKLSIQILYYWNISVVSQYGVTCL